MSCSVVPFGRDASGTVIATETKLPSDPPPVMVTICGLVTAPSEIVSVPGIEPVVAGVNTTVTVQLELAPRVLVHVPPVTA